MNEKSLFIGELIRKVHDELRESQERRELEGHEALFEIDTLTIEANFIVTEHESEGGGFDFKILKYNANASNKNETIHKIVLQLKANQNPFEDDEYDGGGSYSVGGPARKGINPSPYR
ncbi:trypco2 family protein [Vibrio alginolyticus]|uniref:trypco2 family protein n=1 Tax=Vibrio alginolyticus TaxID=663 RepID=UPI001EEF61D5|nr:trypco2 family protein [Vibrio alginolyticus]ULF79166.1 hypothetical protein K6749_06135 [Vibrio alginolyticus]